MKRFKLCLLLTLLCLTGREALGESLVITSWGGAYEDGQRAAYLEAYEAISGTRLDLKAYNGGLAALQPDSGAAAETWDVLDMLEADAIAACEAGLLADFDPSILKAAPDGTAAEEDFVEDSLTDCGVHHVVYSTVIAFDDRAFPGAKPQSVADFFDLERFPGKRALRRDPAAALEWALLSYGVPIAQVYDLLSTERGLALAFKKLDQIRDHIVWWTEGAEPIELLRRGEVSMASGYNGRFFNAHAAEGLPITILWDGQLLDTSVWVIAKSSQNRARAEDFIAYVTSASAMAALAEQLPYGPTRKSAIERIGLHAHSQAPMAHHMPNSPNNLRRAIRQDSRWYARTAALRQRWFDTWLAGELP